MSFSNIIDLLSDDEESEESIQKQMPSQVQPAVQTVQATSTVEQEPSQPAVQLVQAIVMTSTSASFTNNIATTEASNPAIGRSRAKSLDPPASAKDVTDSQRCHSEPPSLTSHDILLVASTVHANQLATVRATQTLDKTSDTSSGSTRRTASKACYDCRKQKMRCEYNAGSGTSCQRCVRVGRPCVNDHSSALPVYSPRTAPQKPANAGPHASVSMQSNGQNVSTKRKQVDRPEIANKRPRNASVAPKTAMAAIQYTAQPGATSTCNTTLWSTPTYQGTDKNGVFSADEATKAALTAIPPTALAPAIASPSTISPANEPVPTNSADPTPRARRTRSRRTMWTCAQLASLATELQNSFDFEGFATRNNKSKAQVFECFSYLVIKPTLEYGAEGQRIARNFHRDLKEYREKNEKNLKEWKRKEGKEVKETAKKKPAGENELGKDKEKIVQQVAPTARMVANVDVTKEGPVKTPVAKTTIEPKETEAFNKAMDIPVVTAKQVDATKQASIDVTSTGNGGDKEKAVVANALINSMKKNDRVEMEIVTRGPIETALALEREKRQQQVGGPGTVVSESKGGQ